MGYNTAVHAPLWRLRGRAFVSAAIVPNKEESGPHPPAHPPPPPHCPSHPRCATAQQQQRKQARKHGPGLAPPVNDESHAERERSSDGRHFAWLSCRPISLSSPDTRSGSTWPTGRRSYAKPPPILCCYVAEGFHHHRMGAAGAYRLLLPASSEGSPSLSSLRDMYTYIYIFAINTKKPTHSTRVPSAWTMRRGCEERCAPTRCASLVFFLGRRGIYIHTLQRAYGCDERRRRRRHRHRTLFATPVPPRRANSFFCSRVIVRRHGNGETRKNEQDFNEGGSSGSGPFTIQDSSPPSLKEETKDSSPCMAPL